MIDEIRKKINNNLFEFSIHALDQSIIRHISIQDFREAILDGEIIEYYPNDKYGPSCLILGFTKSNKPLHIQSTYPERQLIKIITLYEPDTKQWIDFKERYYNEM